jgi:hypothetical protein
MNRPENSDTFFLKACLNDANKQAATYDPQCRS